MLPIACLFFIYLLYLSSRDVQGWVSTGGSRHLARRKLCMQPSPSDPPHIAPKDGIDYQVLLKDIEKLAHLNNLVIEAKETGPYLRLELFPLQSSEAVGYLTAFIRPLPWNMLHLDTIQVKTKKQVLGSKEKSWTKTSDVTVSLLMGSWALSWAASKGCSTAQLLAVKDSDEMNKLLVRLYQSYGFQVLREVGEDLPAVPDRIVWGAVGTLMELDLMTFFKRYTPIIYKMIDGLSKDTDANTVQ